MHRSVDPQRLLNDPFACFIKTGLRLLFVAALLLALAIGSPVFKAEASSWVVTDTASLNAAIAAANAETSGTHTVTFGGNILLTAQTAYVTPLSGVTLIIDGAGYTLDGDGMYKGFTITGGGAVEIQNLTIVNGYSATTSGGGVSNTAILTITDSFLSGNTTLLSGGGITNEATLTVSNCTFTGNSALNEVGGGIFNTGTLTVTNSTFSGNNASMAGGIWNGDWLLLTGSTFLGNSAQEGGGIVNADTLTVFNSTFDNNSASSGSGGGIYSFIGSLTVTNSTFSSNSASSGSGGGIYNYTGTLNLVNVVLANSTSSGDCYNLGMMGTDTHNLIEDHHLCGTPVSSADPLLGSLQDNGGPTETMALLAGSPAIDAGDNGSCPAADQRGEARPVDGDGDATATCDIGAYERNAPIFDDVAWDYWARDYIEGIYQAGITSGCGGGNYCPVMAVSRAQMAKFLLVAEHGSGYTPPAGTGTMFLDVGPGHLFVDWIEQLANEGITSGCGGSNYCPDLPVSRAQMAKFLLIAEQGSGYTPPAGTGTMFLDVGPGHLFVDWIEQLASEGVTSGCGGGNYCPDYSVARDQMAVFLVRTFDLPIP